MKTSEQRLREAYRQRTEAVVARHVAELFRRLPVLSGFCLLPDFRLAELAVFGWSGRVADTDLYADVIQSLVDLVEERPEAVHLIGGRTFARALH